MYHIYCDRDLWFIGDDYEKAICEFNKCILQDPEDTWLLQKVETLVTYSPNLIED